MPPKKRRKRDHPKVEQYVAVATLASELAKLSQQEQQFVALLKQVANLTEHEAACPEKRWFAPDFEYSDEIARDISEYVQQWLREILDHAINIKKKRDCSMQDLRNLDALDNESLKRAALELTDAETRFTTIQHIQHRWSKIVRHESGTDLQAHTNAWLKRWLVQWKKINTSTKRRLGQFRESLKAPFLQVSAVEIHN